MGKLVKSDETILAKFSRLIPLGKSNQPNDEEEGVKLAAMRYASKGGHFNETTALFLSCGARTTPSSCLVFSRNCSVIRLVCFTKWYKESSPRPQLALQSRRGGRVVECTGLENRHTARYRGFERTRQCVHHALYKIRNPEEDFSSSAQLERSESNPTGR